MDFTSLEGLFFFSNPFSILVMTYGKIMDVEFLTGMSDKLDMCEIDDF